MDSNKDNNEIVNPTYKTARITSFLLSRTGEKNAVEFADTLGFSNPFAVDGREPSEDFLNLISTNVEARYNSVAANLKASGSPNLLDLACGYTPRVLDALDAGIDYVGVDQPIVVNELSEKLGDKVKGEKHPLYMGGDLTKAPTIKEAADQLEGEIFISCEGLLIYLNEEELKETLSEIRKVLLEHGGAWYTTDPVNFFAKAAPVLAGNADLMQELGKYYKLLEKERDINAETTDLSDEDTVRRLFEENGFEVEMVPYYSEEFPVKLLDTFSDDQKENLLELLKNLKGWKMTPVSETVIEEG